MVWYMYIVNITRIEKERGYVEIEPRPPERSIVYIGKVWEDTMQALIFTDKKIEGVEPLAEYTSITPFNGVEEHEEA